MNTISVLGCGWLGLPLTRFLLDKGYKVKGSTATPEKLDELESSGIEPYHITLTPEINDDYNPEFLNTDILIINFPPER